MNRRLTIFILAAIAAAAVAVPAFAQKSQLAAKLDNRSTVRALSKARLALLTARSAKSESRRAARTAQAAVNLGNDAKALATATQAELASTHVQSGFAAGGVTTESEAFTSLPGGPTVVVTVPASGLIEVWGQATMSDVGSVSLFEDGQQMAGQSELCANEKTGGALFSGGGFSPEPETTATPSGVGTCGTAGAPGPVLFQTTPGTHTYELRYQLSECPCGPEVTFSKRLLRVAPRL
jgi:acyl-CoA synthetase (AMP-forming)/AMP-acid ligase II